MEHGSTPEISATYENNAQASTDLEVLRQQLLHVRQKYEDLLLSKRRRIAKALLRVRSNNQRQWAKLQSQLLGDLLKQTTHSLEKRLDELTKIYLRDLQERIRETLLVLYEEEETHFIQKAVAHLCGIAAKMNPKSSYHILLNSTDYAKIDSVFSTELSLDHKHEIKKGTAVLTTPMGEVLFDWATPLQNAFRVGEKPVSYTGSR